MVDFTRAYPRACARRVAATNRARLCRRITRRCTAEVSIYGCVYARGERARVHRFALRRILGHVRRSCGTKSRDDRRRKRHNSMPPPFARKLIVIAYVAGRVIPSNIETDSTLIHESEKQLKTDELIVAISSATSSVMKIRYRYRDLSCT